MEPFDEIEVDYDPDDIDMGSREGDVDLSTAHDDLAEITEINTANPIVHPKDVWLPGITIQPRTHACDCAKPRADWDSTLMMSYYTRNYDDFATNRECEGAPYEEMLSWELTARKFDQRLGDGQMNHILNCKGAKANELSYKSLSWKTIRCYDGKVSHDADPWRTDDKSMQLGVPNHRIDMSKPLKDQRWLGEHSIPNAVPCMVKALCICDVLFGFDGQKASAPVGAIDPFAIPGDLLECVDKLKPIRPGTSVIKASNGNQESTLQLRLLWTDNYNPLYSRFRALAYMGLPRDAVQIEDFNYDEPNEARHRYCRRPWPQRRRP